MIKNFFYFFLLKNLRFILLSFSIIIAIFLGLLFFQPEIILYFYPDTLLLGLNDLVNSESHVVTDNIYCKQNGYIFFDSAYISKYLTLSMSLNLYKYKRFIRQLILNKVYDNQEDIVIPMNKIEKVGEFFADSTKKKSMPFDNILMNKKKYTIKPLYYKYIYDLSKRNLYKNELLLKNLLKNSTYLQKLKLEYLEYYESFLLRHRKILRRFSIIRHMLHSFPGVDMSIQNKYLWKDYDINDEDIIDFNPLYLPEYRYLNSVFKFNYLNVYKKYSYYIFQHYFKDRVEPYKFYKFFFKRKGLNLTYNKERYGYPAKDLRLAEEEWMKFAPKLVKEIKNDDERLMYFDQWMGVLNHYELEADKKMMMPLTKYGKYFFSFNGMFNRRNSYDNYGYTLRIGYLGNKKYFKKADHKCHTKRYHFQYFYDEKNLFSKLENINTTRLYTTQYRWDTHLWNGWHIDEYYEVKVNLSSKMRYSYWLNVFSFYKYIFKDYYFFNNKLFSFKKYNISYKDEWFVFPSFYRIINFFFRLFYYFLKMFNFFGIKDDEVILKDNNFYINNINFFTSNIFKIKYGVVFLICSYIFLFFYKIIGFFFFLIGKFFFIIKNLINIIFYNNFIKVFFIKLITIFLDFFELKKKFLYCIMIYAKVLKNLNEFFKEHPRVYRDLISLKDTFLYYFSYISNPIQKRVLRYYKKFFYYKFINNFLLTFNNNYYNYFLYSIFKQITFFKFLGLSSLVIRMFFIKLIVFAFFIYIYTIIISRIWRSYDSDDDIYNWEFFIVIFISFYVLYLLALNLPVLLPFLKFI